RSRGIMPTIASTAATAKPDATQARARTATGPADCSSRTPHDAADNSDSMSRAPRPSRACSQSAATAASGKAATKQTKATSIHTTIVVPGKSSRGAAKLSAAAAMPATLAASHEQRVDSGGIGTLLPAAAPDHAVVGVVPEGDDRIDQEPRPQQLP